jgi:uncharacterized RDD family membrane protein YckC
MDQNPYAAPMAPLEVVGEPGEPGRIGVWPRFGASLIDGVVVVVLGILLMKTLTPLFSGYLAEYDVRTSARMDPRVAAQMAGLLALMQKLVRVSVSAGVVLLIYTLAEAIFGRALGKLALGLRIADVHGRPASIGRMTGRWAAKHAGNLVSMAGMLLGAYSLAQLSLVPTLAIFIGCFFVFGAHRRSLHDLVSGTAVYRNVDVVLGQRRS